MESNYNTKAQLADTNGGGLAGASGSISKKDAEEYARTIAALVASLVVSTGALIDRIDSLQKLIVQDQEDGDEWKKKDE